MDKILIDHLVPAELVKTVDQLEIATVLSIPILKRYQCVSATALPSLLDTISHPLLFIGIHDT